MRLTEHVQALCFEARKLRLEAMEIMPLPWKTRTVPDTTRVMANINAKTNMAMSDEKFIEFMRSRFQHKSQRKLVVL